MQINKNLQKVLVQTRYWLSFTFKVKPMRRSEKILSDFIENDQYISKIYERREQNNVRQGSVHKSLNLRNSSEKAKFEKKSL